MKTSEVLLAAKAKIGTPATWGKWNLASDSAGIYVEPDSLEACRWCLSGALRAVAGSAYGQVRSFMVPLTTCGYLTEYNDLPTTTHADIMALFDRAIEAAKKQEAA